MAMKVDLHCHTMQRSYCSSLDEELLIEHSIRSGLDGIVFTDHGRLPPSKNLERLNDKYHPFRVFVGIEITILMDSSRFYDYQDFIVVGLGNRIMESSWSYDKLLKWVRTNGGWISLSHPFRYNNILPQAIMDNPPDALELYSTHIRAGLLSKIKVLAEKLGCQVVGVSDAHHVRDVGYSAVNLVKSVASDAGLVAELKKGAFELIKPITPGVSTAKASMP